MLSFNLFTVGLITIVCVIATILTYRVLKEEEQKQKAYEESGQTVEDEIQRSLDYEKNSWNRNIPRLTWIYIITMIVSIIGFIIYIV